MAQHGSVLRPWAWRGLAAAAALSVLAHVVFVVARWPGGGAPSATPRQPMPVVTARLIDPVQAAPAALPIEPASAGNERTTVASPDLTAPTEPPRPVAPDTPTAPTMTAVAPSPPPSAASAQAPVAASHAPMPPSEVATAPPPLPAAPASAYFPLPGLDPPPRLLGDIEPRVPEAAGPRGGTVVLRLFINEQGGVDRAEILSSTPPGVFDASALEAFVGAHYSPGYMAGAAVKSQMTFEVKYRGLGGGSESSSRTY